MAKKKKSGKTPKAERELKATVKKLRSRLDAAESATDRWRDKARKHKANAATATAESGRLRKRLEKGSAESGPATKAADPKSGRPRKAAAKTPAARSDTPDATWTLAALRAEARTRGLSGYSRSTKAQLLVRLR